MLDINNINYEGIEDVKQQGQPIISNLSENAASVETANKVVNGILTKANVDSKSQTSINAGLSATCILLQKGATSPRMSDSSSITIGGITVTKAMISDNCRKFKITPRQLARAMSSVIHRICLYRNIQGNQAKNFFIDNPNATPEEMVWASDFQTFNPDCPENVRRWLTFNFKQRFGKASD
jgi:hypothetical protein